MRDAPLRVGAHHQFRAGSLNRTAKTSLGSAAVDTNITQHMRAEFMTQRMLEFVTQEVIEFGSC